MKCVICGNEFKPKTIRSEVCSRRCHDRRKLIRYRKSIMERNQKWLSKHEEWRKEYQNKYQKKYHHKVYKHKYKENPIRFKEKSFVKKHKLEIKKIIGEVCRTCGKELQEIHHIKYKDLPHDNLEEYCKFLIPLCRKCHKIKHSQNIQNNPNI